MRSKCADPWRYSFRSSDEKEALARSISSSLEEGVSATQRRWRSPKTKD